MFLTSRRRTVETNLALIVRRRAIISAFGVNGSNIILNPPCFASPFVDLDRFENLEMLPKNNHVLEALLLQGNIMRPRRLPARQS